MSTKLQENLMSVGLLILRIGFGVYMMTHGWGKVQMVLNGEFDQFADPIGIGVAPSLVLAAGAEFFCAFLVLIGLATRFAAIPVAFTMLVAAFMVHGGDPWTMSGGASKEPALLFFTAFLTLVFTGPGRFSLDSFVAPKLPAPLGKILRP
jgi:putative oxidoreductase